MNAHALAVALQLLTASSPAEKFPTELGGLTSDGATRGFDDPAYGVSVKYSGTEADQLVCSLFVYDLGQKDIGAGLSPAVTKQYAQALGDAKDALPPEGAIKETTEKVDKVQLKLAGWVGLHEGKTKVLTYLLITAHRGQFVKARCTTRITDRALVDKAVLGFVKGVGKHLDALVVP